MSCRTAGRRLRTPTTAPTTSTTVTEKRSTRTLSSRPRGPDTVVTLVRVNDFSIFNLCEEFADLCISCDFFLYAQKYYSSSSYFIQSTLLFLASLAMNDSDPLQYSPNMKHPNPPPNVRPNGPMNNSMKRPPRK
jgi:hypothetical protein